MPPPNVLALPRRWRIVAATVVGMIGVLLGRPAAANPTVAAQPSVDVASPGIVTTDIRLADGSVVVAGGFFQVWDYTRRVHVPRQYLARFLADGSLDLDWDPHPDNPVNALAVDPAGNLYVGGSFGQIQDTARSRLARFRPDLGLDPTWNPIPNDVVSALVYDPASGGLVVGGDFITIGGLLRARIARLSTASWGPADPSWLTTANGRVEHLATNGAGLVFASGQFTQIGGASRVRLAKLGADGSVDPSWNPAPDAAVSGLAYSAAGVLYVSGAFVNIGGQARYGIAKLALAGSGLADATWNPLPNFYPIYAVATDAAGAVYVGGPFTSIGGQPRVAVAKLSGTGSGAPVTAFNANLSMPFYVDHLRADPSGYLTLGGEFNAISGSSAVSMARVNSTSGALATRFAMESFFQAYFLVATPDGGAYLGGSIARVSSGASDLVRYHLLRIKPDGSIDPAFAPVLNGPAFAGVVDPAGNLYVSGLFNQIGTSARAGLARFGPTGVLDPTWAPANNGYVYALAYDRLGELYTGGTFSSIGGQPRSNLARLSTSGSGAADAAWNPGADNRVTLLAADNGAIYAAGDFGTIGGQPRHRLARLTRNASGAADPGFDPAPDNAPNAMCLGPDGALYLAGYFDTLAGQPRHWLAKIDGDGSLDPDWAPMASAPFTIAADRRSNITIGGFFDNIDGDPHTNLARLDSVIGASQPAWSADANGPIDRIAPSVGGRTFVAGRFDLIGGEIRNNLALLLDDAIFADGFD